ncbi:MAG: hypothetical protein ACRELB_10595, partial [Polyangiaceae bacterium]
MELARLRAGERAKRVIVAGSLAGFYVSIVGGTLARDLGLGLAALSVVAGVTLQIARGRGPGPAVVAAGQAEVPPLALVREHGSGCARWFVAGPFAILGAIASLLYMYLVVLMWSDPAPVPFVGTALALFAHTVTLLGMRGLFYRSGLVLDAARGVFFTWWGIGWPWFRRYELLAALSGVGLGREEEGRGWVYVVELQLDGGRRVRLKWPDARNRFLDMADIARSIAAYAGLGEPHGLSGAM